MGEEISSSEFTEEDFNRFQARLREETELLDMWFATNRFSDYGSLGGFELEAWLVNENCFPVSVNEEFLRLLGNPLVVPELAKFNVELNSLPQALHGRALNNMQQQLAGTWQDCNSAARKLGVELLMIGILPTVRDRELTLSHMSSMERYRALNEQVLKLRRQRPITLDIRGREHLHTTHHDVMLEAATTSFQIHLQVPQRQSVRFYNAALILSAPMVAVTANSPYLFRCDLWDETRIPMFEQAVAVSPSAASKRNRVTFGDSYARDSLVECFYKNLDSFAVLLPMVMDDPPSMLCHLRLQNGTIWRWNRPLIGFDSDGTPHLRIEHRVIPAGPSVVDSIANAALFFGLVQALGTAPVAPESTLSFEQARKNFYASAKDGLRASITWLKSREAPVRELLLKELLPLARGGLQELELDQSDIDLYLGVIEGRLRTGQNGAAWQRKYVAQHGKDMRQLACAYRDRQRQGKPVHEWKV